MEIEYENYDSLADYIRKHEKATSECYGKWTFFKRYFEFFYKISANLRTFVKFKQMTKAYKTPLEPSEIFNDLDVICEMMLKEKQFRLTFCNYVEMNESAIEFLIECRIKKDGRIVVKYFYHEKP